MKPRNGTTVFGLLMAHASGYRNSDSGVAARSAGSSAKSAKDNAFAPPTPTTSRAYATRASSHNRAHPPSSGFVKSLTVLMNCVFAETERSSMRWSPSTTRASSGAASTAAWNSLSSRKRMGDPLGWNLSVFAQRVGHVSSTTALSSPLSPSDATVEDASSMDAGL